MENVFYDLSLVKKILQFYPKLGQPRNVRSGGGTAGRNLIFSTDRGKYFLRGRNPKYCSEEEILYDHSLVEHISKNNVSTPLPIVSSEGKTWLFLDGLAYEIYEFIFGRPFNQKSMVDLKNAARSLALFHLATRNFTPEGAKPRALLREDHPTLIKPILDALLKKTRKKSKLHSKIGYLSSQLHNVSKELPNSKYLGLHHSIIHGDFHPSNIIFKKDGRIFFTDFDWASFQAKAVDIADGIIFFAGVRESTIDGSQIMSITQTFKINLERTKIFLDAYRGENKIARNEIKRIPWLIRSRWIQCIAKGSLKLPHTERNRYFARNMEEPLIWLDKNEEILVANLE